MDFSTYLLRVLGIGAGTALPVYLFYAYVRRSNRKYKKWEEDNKHKPKKHVLTEEELTKKREEEETQRIIEEEKNRKTQEQYSTKKFKGRPQGIFLFVASATFIFCVVTLIIEWNWENRYYDYKIICWILVGMFVLFGISSNIEETWEKIYQLKPEEQREKYEYNMDYIYTDSIITLVSYIISKAISRIVFIVIVIGGGYLLLSWLGDKVEEMDLKSIVIIGMIIIISILIGIYKKVNNKE